MFELSEGSLPVALERQEDVTQLTQAATGIKFHRYGNPASLVQAVQLRNRPVSYQEIPSPLNHTDIEGRTQGSGQGLVVIRVIY